MQRHSTFLPLLLQNSSKSSHVACTPSSLKSLSAPHPQLHHRLFQKVVERDWQQNHQRRKKDKSCGARENVVKPIEHEPDAEEMGQVNAVRIFRDETTGFGKPGRGDLCEEWRGSAKRQAGNPAFSPRVASQVLIPKK